METRRLSALDSLRGLAAMGIAFFWHYQIFSPEILPLNKKAYWFYNYGLTLVDLFFVLSGFVFCYVYKDKIEKHIISFKEYAFLRFSRLYPLLIVTLIFVAVVQTLRMALLHNYFAIYCNDVYHFIMNIFCIQRGWFETDYSFNGASWSVGCEIVMYLLFYFFIYKFSDNKKYIFGYVFMIFLGLFISKTNMNYPLFNWFMARACISFFIGCITYEFNKYTSKSIYKNKIVFMYTSIFLIVISSASIFGHAVLGDWFKVYQILIYPLLILISLNLPIINKLLSLRVLTYLGNISFSIYLWNFPIMLFIKTIDDLFRININYSSKLFFLMFILISLLVSALSYELIEKRGKKYLRNKYLKNIVKE